MNRFHRILLPLICGVILLSGCGKDSLPEAYSIGEDSLPALTALVTLDPEPQCTVLTTEDGATSYQYTELEEPTQAVAEYRTALETEYDCVALSAEGDPLPGDEDLAPEGELILSKESSSGSGAFLLSLSWGVSACTATPSVDVASEEDNASTVTPPESSMTMQEVTTYFLSLSPAQLELSGESLEGCTAFCENGLVLLDGVPCVCVNLYRSGVIQGSYLFDPTTQDIYRLDRSTGIARLLGAG